MFYIWEPCGTASLKTDPVEEKFLFKWWWIQVTEFLKKSISFLWDWWCYFAFLLGNSCPGVTIESGLNLVSSGQINLVIDNGNEKRWRIICSDPSNTVIFQRGRWAVSAVLNLPASTITCQGAGTKINAGTTSRNQNISCAGLQPYWILMVLQMINLLPIKSSIR